MEKKIKKKLERTAREMITRSKKGLDFIPSEEEIKERNKNVHAMFDEEIIDGQYFVFCFLQEANEYICAVAGIIENDRLKIIEKTTDKKTIMNLL